MSIDFGIVTVMPHFLPPVWQIFFIANMRREHNVSAFFKHRQKHQVQCFFLHRLKITSLRIVCVHS